MERQLSCTSQTGTVRDVFIQQRSFADAAPIEVVTGRVKQSPLAPVVSNGVASLVTCGGKGLSARTVTAASCVGSRGTSYAPLETRRNVSEPYHRDTILPELDLTIGTPRGRDSSPTPSNNTISQFLRHNSRPSNCVSRRTSGGFDPYMSLTASPEPRTLHFTSYSRVLSEVQRADDGTRATTLPPAALESSLDRLRAPRSGRSAYGSGSDKPLFASGSRTHSSGMFPTGSDEEIFCFLTRQSESADGAARSGTATRVMRSPLVSPTQAVPWQDVPKDGALLGLGQGRGREAIRGRSAPVGAHQPVVAAPPEGSWSPSRERAISTNMLPATRAVVVGTLDPEDLYQRARSAAAHSTPAAGSKGDNAQYLVNVPDQRRRWSLTSESAVQSHDASLDATPDALTALDASRKCSEAASFRSHSRSRDRSNERDGGLAQRFAAHAAAPPTPNPNTATTLTRNDSAQRDILMYTGNEGAQELQATDKKSECSAEVATRVPSGSDGHEVLASLAATYSIIGSFEDLFRDLAELAEEIHVLHDVSVQAPPKVSTSSHKPSDATGDVPILSAKIATSSRRGRSYPTRVRGEAGKGVDEFTFRQGRKARGHALPRTASATAGSKRKGMTVGLKRRRSSSSESFTWISSRSSSVTDDCLIHGGYPHLSAKCCNEALQRRPPKPPAKGQERVWKVKVMNPPSEQRHRHQKTSLQNY